MGLGCPSCHHPVYIDGITANQGGGHRVRLHIGGGCIWLESLFGGSPLCDLSSPPPLTFPPFSFHSGLSVRPSTPTFLPFPLSLSLVPLHPPLCLPSFFTLPSLYPPSRCFLFSSPALSFASLRSLRSIPPSFLSPHSFLSFLLHSPPLSSPLRFILSSSPSTSSPSSLSLSALPSPNPPPFLSLSFLLLFLPLGLPVRWDTSLPFLSSALPPPPPPALFLLPLQPPLAAARSPGEAAGREALVVLNSM